MFDLRTNGEYVIQAQRQIPKLGQDVLTNVVSGKATFRVTSPPEGTGQKP